MDTLFEAQSPLGYTVVCSKNYWDEHIANRKPVMKDKEQFVIDTVENPIVIYESNENPDRDVYFGKFSSPNLFSKVIVGGTKSERNFITAFPVKEIDGNINKKVTKYDIFQN